jgi:hypothetical protein
VATKRARAADESNPLHQAGRLQELVARFGVEAMTFTAKPKVADTARQWLARANLDPDDPLSGDTVANALMLALELATFAPSLSGSTAVDRLVRQRKPANGEEQAALEALRQASFRLLRIRSLARDGVLPAEDLATGKTLSILDRAIPSPIRGWRRSKWRPCSGAPPLGSAGMRRRLIAWPRRSSAASPETGSPARCASCSTI